jgi:hypothetical protein
MESSEGKSELPQTNRGSMSLANSERKINERFYRKPDGQNSGGDFLERKTVIGSPRMASASQSRSLSGIGGISILISEQIFSEKTSF